MRSPVNTPLRQRSAMLGLTLIELMVAMVIGLLLILGVIQIFSASRSAYQLSAGLARVQENGRFALDYLQRDMRMVGHFGCVNDQAHTRQSPATLTTTLAATHPALLFGESIQGFEANDTEPGSEVTLSQTPTAGGDAYTPALPAEFAAALDNRVAGSDIVALRFLAPDGVPVTSISGTPAAPQFNFDASRLPVLQSGVTNPGLFGVADCLSATVFQAGAVDAGGAVVMNASAPNNTGDFTSVFTAGQTMLYRAEIVIYYVGVNNEGTSSLYRLRYQATPNGALVPQKEELVEGVENMQILYGQDRVVDPALPPTGYIDKQEVAGDIETSTTLPADGWRRIGAVQLGLVMSSPEIAGAPQAESDSPSALNALGTTFKPPSDGHYRSVYQTTIALRNRLYGN